MNIEHSVSLCHFCRINLENDNTYVRSVYLFTCDSLSDRSPKGMLNFDLNNIGSMTVHLNHSQIYP